MTRGMPRMDVDRARELRAEGFKWREIGEMLAREVRRPMPYQAVSVSRACDPQRVWKDTSRDLNRNDKP